LDTTIPINETELRKMHGRRVSITKMAAHFGCSVKTIRARMDRIGIRRGRGVTPKRRDPTPAEIKKMGALLRAKRPPEVEAERTWTPPNFSWDGQAFRTLN
jgi:hypothetical protein